MGPDIAPERAGKLIAYLAKESRSVLANEKNVLLEKRIKKVARKAKVPFFQSRDYILKTLAWAAASSAPQEQEKQLLHFLVVGHTNPFEVALDPLFLFFDTEDEGVCTRTGTRSSAISRAGIGPAATRIGGYWLGCARTRV